jgi:uncharacterized protein YhaN
MILKELNLISFGKFENKVVNLEKGVNIIYGENESGKTTVHNFINGMFYGFLKPYVRRTIYLEEHNRYSPWNSNRYRGIITFDYEDKSYRIEREFTKDKELTKVLDEVTGEDITYRINNGENGKVLQPGIHFFGFNNTVFTNTISIKQLGAETEVTLANEVRDKIINVTTTLDDTISVDKAINDLNNELKEIGSEKANNKPYAMNLHNLEKLMNEKADILNHREKYEELLEENFRLNNLLDKEEIKLKELKGKLYEFEILEKIKIYDEAIELTNNINEIEKELLVLKLYSNLSFDDFSEGIIIKNRIESIDNGIDECNKEIENIDIRLTTMDRDKVYNEKLNNYEEIRIDYHNYEELEEEKNKLLYNKEESQLEFLKRDYESNKNKLKKIYIGLSITCIFTLGFLFLGIINKYLFLLLIPAIVSITYFINCSKKDKDVIGKIRDEIYAMETKEIERNSKIKEIDILLENLLNKYKTHSKLEIKKLYETLQMEVYIENNNIKLNKELNNKKKDLLQKKENLEIEKNKALVNLDNILKVNNSTSLEEFKNGLNKKSLYEDCKKDKDIKIQLLDKILGNYTIDGLRSQLFNVKQEFFYELDDIDKNKLETLINTSIENTSNLKIKIKGVEENLNFLSLKMNRLVEVDEEIQRAENIKLHYDNKKQSIELAIKTIETLSKDIHSQFAPAINRKVGETIKKISGGKYENVKINSKLGIGVENPITKEIMDIDSLSGGTIDQLYFSLRFGIISSMKGDSFPLILDDCFIQYDDNRLTNILKFLCEISKDRQIILFTCHNREKEVLKKLDVKFNSIILC